MAASKPTKQPATTKGKVKHAQSAQVAKITRSTVMFLLLGLAVAGAIFHFVYSKQADARSAAREQLQATESLVAKEEADLQAVRAGSADSLRALHEKVTALGRVVPTDVDGLEVAVWLGSTVPSGLSELSIPAPATPVAVEGVPGLQKYTVPVTVSGPRAQLLAWVQTLQSAPERLLTVESADLRTGGEDGQAQLTLTLAIWQATEDLLVPPVPGIAPAPAPDGVDDPAAPADGELNDPDVPGAGGELDPGMAPPDAGEPAAPPPPDGADPGAAPDDLEPTPGDS